MARTIFPGKPYPLGAKWDGTGANFSIYSERAEAVELCLFREAGEQTDCIQLPEVTAFVWHGYLHGISPGSIMGTVCMARGSPNKGSGSIRQSCWSTPTRRPLLDACAGTRRSFRINSGAPMPI